MDVTRLLDRTKFKVKFVEDSYGPVCAPFSPVCLDSEEVSTKSKLERSDLFEEEDDMEEVFK
ncbi:hypothetical protein RYX36_011442, partial [Vicia faba]